MSELTDAETQRLRESIKALEQRDGADASIVREGAVCAMTRRQGRNNVVPTGEDYEAAREAIASLIRDRVAPGLRAPTNDPIRQAYSLVIDALYADWAENTVMREWAFGQLTQIVNVVRGEPGPLSAHSLHDVAERVEAVAAKLARLRERIEALAGDWESGRNPDTCGECDRADVLRALLDEEADQ